MLKWTGRIALGLLLLLVVWIGASLGYRAFRQHQNEQLLIVESSNGIDESMFIDVRGVEQWITIRGQDRNNPVLLVVHGGPGSALSPLATSFLPFETDYTVVQWDQQGAGKTFSRNDGRIPEGMTIGDVAADGVAVAEHVAERLDKDRVILVGMSWGSVIGIEMARERPDLFYAFVGTGQAVHRDEGRIAAYDQLLERARATNNADAVVELEAIGRPPHDPDGARVVRRWIGELSSATQSASRLEQVLYAPRYSLSDVWSYFGGFMASDEHFDTGVVDLRAGGLEFDVPIFMIQGTEDYTTPPTLARTYFDMIEAPQKEFIPIEGGGHTLPVDNAEAFVTHLNARIRPLATASAGNPEVRR